MRNKNNTSESKRLTKWIIGLAALAFTTFVSTNATNLGNVFSLFIGTLFSSQGLPVQIDTVSLVQGEGDTHAFASPFVLSDNELSQLNALNQMGPLYHLWFSGRHVWFSGRHAVDTEATIVEFVVEGNRTHTVRITNIQPLASCGKPLTGTLFYSPSAGIDATTQILLNLDDPHALPSFISEDENGDSSPRKDFFGTHSVSLQKGEQSTFKVVAGTATHFCQFTLAMSVLDGDKTVTETITNNGQPFQVTAIPHPSTRGEFSAYQVLYIGGVANADAGGGTNSFGNDLWARADPNTYCEGC